MNQIVPKKINLQLVGLDGNAFSIMGAFSRQARKEGWSKEEIESVTDEMMAGDYDHLLQVAIAHCNDGEVEEEEDDDDYDMEIEEYNREK